MIKIFFLMTPSRNHYASVAFGREVGWIRGVVQEKEWAGLKKACERKWKMTIGRF